eukprot:CAMPEP_0172310362 /NCGR_PEP_ID=MMETSP1058-20130122/11445_1 /TAXON_ID=83371 /ORGANISM="Detonula confervacea, Strain CCMP 353" /LENGTH=62 /DNA_ID=CAMNT_0013023159 /DNA_START=399 /DNA_END=584 /DNA_ORIENTATION=+
MRNCKKEEEFDMSAQYNLIPLIHIQDTIALIDITSASLFISSAFTFQQLRKKNKRKIISNNN